MIIEACVDAIDAALGAEKGGANRIELCGELMQGGVTPSAGLIAAVWEGLEQIPLFVLIRPRTGDFLYSDAEFDVMLRDIEQAQALDVDGVVFGALTSSGDVDVRITHALVEAAGTMEVTFHRAFDFARDQSLAMETLVELGVDRILTSGGASSAEKGIEQLAQLSAQAAGRIAIMAGGSITAENAGEIVRRTGVKEIHVRATRTTQSAMTYKRSDLTLARPQQIDDYDRRVTHADEVARVVAAVAL